MVTLLEAALAGDEGTVELLTSQKADVNEQTKDGFTALALCVRNNHRATFKVLLEAKSDVNIASADGFTALTLAARHGHIDMIHDLLARGAKLESTTLSGGTALMWAAHNGHTDVVQSLLRAQAVVRQRHHPGALPRPARVFGGTNASWMCCSRPHLCGVQVDFVNTIGLTALIFGSQNGYQDTVHVRAPLMRCVAPSIRRVPCESLHKR